jgi:hypothetical protein
MHLFAWMQVKAIDQRIQTMLSKLSLPALNFPVDWKSPDTISVAIAATIGAASLLALTIVSRSQDSHQKITVDKQGTVSNWFGNQTWKPAQIFSPSSLDELKECLKFAREHKNSKGDSQPLCARAAGSLHSWSPSAAIPDGVMIHMKNMNDILDVDLEKRTVTVEAGVSFKLQ